MINILIKLENNRSIMVLSDGSIKLFEKSVDELMDEYLMSLLSSYSGSFLKVKGLPGFSKYKSPIIYNCSEGLNVLIPLKSTRNKTCMWVSFDYCLNNSREDFYILTGKKISYHQWYRIIQIGLICIKTFNLNLAIPEDFEKITKHELKVLLEET